MKVGLVLGAGGTVGVAYHAGVLRAFEEAGLAAERCDLLVGTSAGSVAAACLRSGWKAVDLAERITDSGLLGWRPAFRNPAQLVRRGVGSAFVLGRSALRLPAPVVPRSLKRAFPGGLFSFSTAGQRMVGELPAAWPEEALWLCAVDISSGKRVVLGRPGSPAVPMSKAVLASCAIPGVYPPVGVGRRTLVDGGVHSTTNLDLAAKAGCDLVVGVAPMAFDTDRRPGPARQLSRRGAARSLSAEVAYARKRGAEVLLVRPSPAELRVHGGDLMRADGLDRVVTSAYEATARLLGTSRFRDGLAALG